LKNGLDGFVQNDLGSARRLAHFTERGYGVGLDTVCSRVRPEPPAEAPQVTYSSSSFWIFIMLSAAWGSWYFLTGGGGL